MTNIIFPIELPSFLAPDRTNRVYVRIEIRGKMAGFLIRPFLVLSSEGDQQYIACGRCYFEPLVAADSYHPDNFAIAIE